MPWQPHAGLAHPWRRDSRLARWGEPGYPDDYQVLFANPDSARGGRHEVMWVRAIAYDRPTGLFLAILLNKPDFLHSVQQGDNVVFRVRAPDGYLVAVGAPDYGSAGWPATQSSFAAVIRDGVRAYRAGANGHNISEIERCVSVLTPAMRTVPPSSSHQERFVGHYVLGRCLAEKYATTLAIEQFRAAIALDSSDADAHMALLAEFSVMVHQRPGTLTSADEARWSREFLRELAIVRARFANNEAVNQVLTMIFDPSQESQLDSIWLPHVARLRRVGYAMFRWKQR
jgi:hypothetical protein